MGESKWQYIIRLLKTPFIQERICGPHLTRCVEVYDTIWNGWEYENRTNLFPQVDDVILSENEVSAGVPARLQFTLMVSVTDPASLTSKANITVEVIPVDMSRIGFKRLDGWFIHLVSGLAADGSLVVAESMVRITAVLVYHYDLALVL